MHGYMHAMCFDKIQLLLDEMRARRLTPDSLTFASLLEGLSKAKLFDEAVRLYRDMVASGVPLQRTQSTPHWWCCVA
jgi:pentatricopeptide repeat protein